MTLRRFEDIQAWQEARALVSQVYKLTREGALSKDFGLRDQLQRASVSVMANIAEGFDCDLNVEFGRFLGIARRSAVEVQSLLYAASDIGYLSLDEFKFAYDQANKTKAFVSAFRKALLKKNINGITDLVIIAMRILYFSKDYSPHDHRFLSSLAATEHKVFYLRLEGNQRQLEDRPVPPQIEQIQWAGREKPFAWGDVPRLAIDLRRVIREIKPDLIHAGPIQTCAFLAVLSGFRPILTMSWGFDLMRDAERNSWWRWVTGYTLKRSTFFTSDAQVTRAKAVAYGMNPNRTVVFPWGVDLQRFGVKPPQVNDRHPIVLFCNRSWEPLYGVDVIAKAFVKVAQQRKNVSLLLVGAGSQAQTLRQILMNGGVLERVQFGGQISYTDMPRWLRMADLYISASHVDGSSVSLMEALACGLPTLVSDIPANKEWVSEGVNGWLFPDGNAEALAEKILAVSSQGKKLDQISQAARKTAEERADWKKNFSVLLKAYEEAVQCR